MGRLCLSQSPVDKGIVPRSVQSRPSLRSIRDLEVEPATPLPNSCRHACTQCSSNEHLAPDQAHFSVRWWPETSSLEHTNSFAGILDQARITMLLSCGGNGLLSRDLCQMAMSANTSTCPRESTCGTPPWGTRPTTLQFSSYMGEPGTAIRCSTRRTCLPGPGESFYRSESFPRRSSHVKDEPCF